jgi:hypothetical protein
MLTRRLSAAAMLMAFALAGCAGNTPAASTAPPAPAVSDLAPMPSAASGEGTSTGGQTITGKVTAGVEPNCLLLQDLAGSHLLVIRDAALRAQVHEGAEVTVVGKSEPTMMSTCQQGVPFIVSSVSGG